MKLRYEETVYTDACGCIEHPAVFIYWPEVERFLGEPHRGDADQEERLIRGLREAGAPAWVEDEDALGWGDEFGWGLYRTE